MRNRYNRRYSPAGDAILSEGFTAGISVDELLVQLNANNLEGNQPWNAHALKHRCRALQLYRPAWFRAEACRAGVMAHLASRERGETPAPRTRPARILADYKQKPLPLELTLCLPRDGGVSVATLDALAEVASYAVAWCDRETAENWGGRWAGTRRNLDVINTKRREYELPIFAISDRKT